jgi:hypothetical protein
MPEADGADSSSRSFDTTESECRCRSTCPPDEQKNRAPQMNVGTRKKFIIFRYIPPPCHIEYTELKTSSYSIFLQELQSIFTPTPAGN